MSYTDVQYNKIIDHWYALLDSVNPTTAQHAVTDLGELGLKLVIFVELGILTGNVRPASWTLSQPVSASPEIYLPTVDKTVPHPMRGKRRASQDTLRLWLNKVRQEAQRQSKARSQQWIATEVTRRVREVEASLGTLAQKQKEKLTSDYTQAVKLEAIRKPDLTLMRKFALGLSIAYAFWPDFTGNDVREYIGEFDNGFWADNICSKLRLSNDSVLAKVHDLTPAGYAIVMQEADDSEKQQETVKVSA